MTKKRFHLPQGLLHFKDNQDPLCNPNDPDRDRLFKVKAIIDILKQSSRTVYYPPERLTVDESLVLYKGRLLLKQYIQIQCAKYSIKMFDIARADGILFHLMIYQGIIQPTPYLSIGLNWLQT